MEWTRLHLTGVDATPASPPGCEFRQDRPTFGLDRERSTMRPWRPNRECDWLIELP
ncbi:hypothetical protein ASPCADRAFT_204659, partial [Aspergillus carbonarius ITEM 5010]